MSMREKNDGVGTAAREGAVGVEDHHADRGPG